jgi:glutamine cyclotransferase
MVPRDTPIYDTEVVATFPHDRHAYCQGLLWFDGALYESTGRHGQSSVRRVEVETGRVEKIESLPSNLFGEGLALHGDRLYQLTWRAGVARVYERESLALIDELAYEGEGWGLTSDGRHLIQSDGSSTLRFRDPATFETVRQIEVQDGDVPIAKLNELEFIGGEVYANVWQTDRIARIDPRTGKVLGWIQLAGLFDYAEHPDPDAVPNGIAYDPEGKRLFVTGKLWPSLFEIELTRR